MKRKTLGRVLVAAIFVSAFVFAGGGSLYAVNTTVISDFENISSWKKNAAEKVELKLSQDKGKAGKALAMDFDFSKNKAYVIAIKSVDIKLAENYQFTFYIKGTSPDNTFEFKIVDDNGNTYWRRFGDFVFPLQWTKMTISKEDIGFAWGPAAGKALKKIKSIELAVSCGAGGAGKVYFDELCITELPVSELDKFRANHDISVTASGSEGEQLPQNAADNNMGTRWKAGYAGPGWIQIDIGKEEDIAGAVILWEAHASKYDIYVSRDGKSMKKVFSASEGDGKSDVVYFKPEKARYIKIDCRESASSMPFSIYEIKVIPTSLYPEVQAASNADTARNILDGDMNTQWTGKSSSQKLVIDFKEIQNFGGIIVYWGDCVINSRKISVSGDMDNWEEIYSSKRETRGVEKIYPEAFNARYIRIEASSKGRPVSIREVTPRRQDEKGSNQIFFQVAAEKNPKGLYPRWVTREQEFWTLVGVTDDDVESLFSEDGVIEPWHYSSSFAPFVRIGDKLVTRCDVEVTQSLEDGYLPLPKVTWKGRDFEMEIKAYGADEGMKSSTYMQYTIINRKKDPLKGKFYLAARPFQVNPPWQGGGGLSGISEIEYDFKKPGMMKINGKNALYAPVAPDKYGTSVFGRDDIYGDISEDILKGKLSGQVKKFTDSKGYGSAALEYDFNIPASGTRSFYFAIPLHGNDNQIDKKIDSSKIDAYFGGKYESVRKLWTEKLDRVKIELPDMEFVNTLKSQIAYILLNDDNYRLQPGSRNYEKSWIRDGSVTARALLSMGYDDEVKRYLNWFNKFIKDDGWIPFIVDGNDQIVTWGWKEYDSQGQYLFAVYEYFMFTKDMEFLKRSKNHIINDVKFIQGLRAQRKTADYASDPEKKRFYGIFPESASHEGYVDHPMHSYWDDFYGILGMKDAVLALKALGDDEKAKWADDERKDFQECFYRSIQEVSKKFKIDYIPGCADIWWADPTATAIGAWPCLELDNMPKDLTENTFELYWKNLAYRIKGEWGGDFTPYELRIANAFLMMGETEKLNKMISSYFTWKYPREWNHWAEVVVRNPRAEHYIGDMPHTWIGSDYICVIRNMFILEEGDTLYLGKGICKEWLENGKRISITDMPTHFGKISYNVESLDNKIKINISGNLKNIAKTIFVIPKLDSPVKSVELNGKSCEMKKGGIEIDKLPSEISIYY
ncbi:MAG: discoidin domain-containing protein [Elusimicrobiota bacterium]